METKRESLGDLSISTCAFLTYIPFKTRRHYKPQNPTKINDTNIHFVLVIFRVVWVVFVDGDGGVGGGGGDGNGKMNKRKRNISHKTYIEVCFRLQAIRAKLAKESTRIISVWNRNHKITNLQYGLKWAEKVSEAKSISLCTFLLLAFVFLFLVLSTRLHNIWWTNERCKAPK